MKALIIFSFLALSFQVSFANEAGEKKTDDCTYTADSLARGKKETDQQATAPADETVKPATKAKSV